MQIVHLTGIVHYIKIGNRSNKLITLDQEQCMLTQFND
jgi:hypothetical protein